MKKLSFCIIFSMFLLILTGCGAKKQDDSRKMLNVAESAELSTMDSVIATDTISLAAIGATVEGLYRNGKDGKLIPTMAESVEISNDKKIYTFKLREANWSNNKPVTAKDFVFAWKRLANPKTGAEYANMLVVAGVKNAEKIVKGNLSVDELGITAIDDKTLKVELDNAVPYFLSLTTFPSFYPIQEEFYKQHGDTYGIKADATLANGPFKMVSWNQGVGYTMIKNNEYYDADKVKLDGINFQIIKEEQAGIVAYEQGKIDIISLSGDLGELYRNSPEFVQIKDPIMSYISLNKKTLGLDNINLRKAIALSVDKQQIAENIVRNGSIPANFIVPIGLAYDENGKDFREGQEYLSPNKEEAQKYFQLAKKELNKENFEFEFLFNEGEVARKIAEFFKSEIEKNLPGVVINIKQVPFKERLRLTSLHEFQIAFVAWGPDYSDPLTFLDLWITNGAYNYGQWSNLEYDKIIKSASSGELLLNREARWKALQKAEEILLNDVAIIPIYQRNTGKLIKSNVNGVEYYPVGVSKSYKNATKN